MSKFRDPIDYEETILTVTQNIWKHYKERLDIEAHKMSKEKYIKVGDALVQFIDNSTKDCFYEGRKWTSWGDVLLSISDARSLVESFFEAAKQYKDAKAAGKDTIREEQALADAAKKVNLRVKTRCSVVAELVGKLTPSWLYTAHTSNSK